MHGPEPLGPIRGRRGVRVRRLSPHRGGPVTQVLRISARPWECRETDPLALKDWPSRGQSPPAHTGLKLRRSQLLGLGAARGLGRIRSAGARLLRVVGDLEGRSAGLQQRLAALEAASPAAAPDDWQGRVTAVAKQALADHGAAELAAELPPLHSSPIIWNRASGRVHACNTRVGPPATWTTICGWPWGPSIDAAVYECDSSLPVGAAPCHRCLANHEGRSAFLWLPEHVRTSLGVQED